MERSVRFLQARRRRHRTEARRAVFRAGQDEHNVKFLFTRRTLKSFSASNGRFQTRFAWFNSLSEEICGRETDLCAYSFSSNNFSHRSIPLFANRPGPAASR